MLLTNLCGVAYYSAAILVLFFYLLRGAGDRTFGRQGSTELELKGKVYICTNQACTGWRVGIFDPGPQKVLFLFTGRADLPLRP